MRSPLPAGRLSAKLMAIVVPLVLLLAACDEAEEKEQAYRATSENAAAQSEITSDEPSLAAAYLAGRFAESQRDLNAAAGFYQRALKMDPDDERLRKLTFLALIGDGRFKQAIPLGREIVKADPKFPLGKLVLAIASVRDGDYAAAQEQVTDLPKMQLNEIVLPMALAWTQVGQGKHADGITALEPLASRRGFKTFHSLHAALIQDLAGDTEAAEKNYREALGDRERPPARLVQALASFYQRHGRAADAKDLMYRYAKANPGSELLRANIRYFEASGKIPPIAADPRQGFAEALFDVASAFFRENSVRFALLYGRLALMTWPDFAAAQMLVAEILETQELRGAANDMLSEIKKDTPFYWPAQVRIASNLNFLGDTEQSIKTLEEISTKREDDPNPLIDMGDILRSKERFPEAVKAYDRAMKRVPEIKTYHWTLFYSRGIALERAKQWDRAEKDFLKALELQPDQPYVLNYLGYSWVERGKRLDRAQEMIEKAVAQRPNDGYIVDSLGWVLYRMGQFDEAVDHLEKAVELRPQDAVINDHLGDAYWRVGRRHEARIQWNRALSLKPEDDLVPTIEGKLRSGLGPAIAPGGPDQQEL